MVEAAYGAGQEIGVGSAEGSFEKLPRFRTVQRFVGRPRSGRERTQETAGDARAPTGHRLRVEADEDVVVTVEDRLQSGEGGDQAPFIQVSRSRPQTHFHLPFADEIGVPGVVLIRDCWTGTGLVDAGGPIGRGSRIRSGIGVGIGSRRRRGAGDFTGGPVSLGGPRPGSRPFAGEIDNSHTANAAPPTIRLQRSRWRPAQAILQPGISRFLLKR